MRATGRLPKMWPGVGSRSSVTDLAGGLCRRIRVRCLRVTTASRHPSTFAKIRTLPEAERGEVNDGENHACRRAHGHLCDESRN